MVFSTLRKTLEKTYIWSMFYCIMMFYLVTLPLPCISLAHTHSSDSETDKWIEESELGVWILRINAYLGLKVHMKINKFLNILWQKLIVCFSKKLSTKYATCSDQKMRYSSNIFRADDSGKTSGWWNKNHISTFTQP